MSVQVEKLENSMAKLTVEVPADALEKAIQSAYLKNRSRISVPGFRKGKAPRSLIEKMYGAGIFYEDASNELINQEYPNAMEECGESIVSNPKLEVVQVEAGKPFVFTAEVALKPPVGLGKYKGIEVVPMDTAVTDEEVEAELKRQQETNARMIDVTDRAVEADDHITLDFNGTVDGSAFDGGKGEDYPLTIGSGSFIPGFEEQLIGMEIGKEAEVHVTFPKDYHEKSLAGKDAVFTCTVKSIRKKELPELNDEFAGDVSEFDTLDEYRADVRKKLVERKEKEEKAKREDACIQALIGDSEIELPEPMIETQQQQMVNEFAQRLQMQGLRFDQYMKYTGGTAEGMMEQVRPQAIERIKARLVLEAVAEKEKLAASDEEYEAQLEKMAKDYGLELDKLKETVGEKQEKQIRDDLAVEKAAEFLTAHAKETKKKAPKDDAEAADKGAVKRAPRKKAEKKEEKTEEATEA